MPTFTSPKWVHVEPRSFPVAAVAVLAVIGYGGYEVVAWLASVMLAIVTVLAITGAAAAATLAVVVYRRRGVQHLDAPQWVVERCGAPRIPSYGAGPVRLASAVAAAPRPAMEVAGVHYHLHLDVVERPAIENDRAG